MRTCVFYPGRVKKKKKKKKKEVTLVSYHRFLCIKTLLNFKKSIGKYSFTDTWCTGYPMTTKGLWSSRLLDKSYSRLVNIVKTEIITPRTTRFKSLQSLRDVHFLNNYSSSTSTLILCNMTAPQRMVMWLGWKKFDHSEWKYKSTDNTDDINRFSTSKRTIISTV